MDDRRDALLMPATTLAIPSASAPAAGLRMSVTLTKSACACPCSAPMQTAF